MATGSGDPRGAPINGGWTLARPKRQLWLIAARALRCVARGRWEQNVRTFAPKASSAALGTHSPHAARHPSCTPHGGTSTAAIRFDGQHLAPARIPVYKPRPAHADRSSLFRSSTFLSPVVRSRRPLSFLLHAQLVCLCCFSCSNSTASLCPVHRPSFPLPARSRRSSSLALSFSLR